MSKIPQELLRPILEHLKSEKPLLCAVSLCSSALRHEAQRILFRDVTTLYRLSAHAKFLRTVTASPDRLALYVHVYRFSVFTTTERGLIEVVSTGLQAMVNLARLTLRVERVHSGSHFWSLAPLLSKCRFTLERFDCMTEPSDVQKLIDTFLPMQGDLRHLGIQYSLSFSGYSLSAVNHRLKTIKSTVCPLLSSVEGTWDVIYGLLPKHQITTLAVIHTHTTSNTNIGALAPALASITALSYQISLSNTEALDYLPKFFTSLHVLETELTAMVDDEDIDTVCQLTELHTLILSQFSWTDDLPEDPLPIVSKLFGKFSMNLEYIDYQVEARAYARYTYMRGVTAEVQKVSKNEVRQWWLSG